MSRRGVVSVLKDVLEAIDRIQRYVGMMSQAEFLQNTEKQDAVVRNLEIIGEADLEDLNGRPWQLTALYDAGKIPGGSSRRYSTDRDLDMGGDGWGRERSLSFLQANSDLWFNDLSLEHGGFWRDHIGHMRGLEIDVRYFGASVGDSELLNGKGLPGGDEDHTGAYRLGVLTDAQNGNVVAQRRIWKWITENRAEIDALLATGLLRQVLIGRVVWNQDSLFRGLYPDGTTQIVNPDAAGHPWIGAWHPCRVGTAQYHLGHVHLDILRRP